MTFLPRTSDPNIQPDTVCALTLEGEGVGGEYIWITVLGYTTHNANEVARVKRVHSIAQKRAGSGYDLSGSFQRSLTWREGAVRNQNGNWALWTAGITPAAENGSYPVNTARVDWDPVSPFTREINILVNLVPAP